MHGLLRFIKYNNALPIAVSFLLLSFGGALAASPDVRDSVGDVILETEQRVLSIDNTYIANKDLGSYTPKVQITGVTEDTENYYVAYVFTTIDVVDHVWQDVAEQRTMTVAKAAIAGKDLGLYVTEQLKQVIDREVAYLTEVQGIERAQISQKVVATAYSGLVGALLDDRTEVLPGYTPVVAEPVAAAPAKEEDPSAGSPSPEQSEGEPVGTVAGASTQAPQSGSSSVSEGSDTTPPSIQILGANPARIYVGSTYNDLGAVVTDNVNQNLGYAVSVDGRQVTEVQIDTTVGGTYAVRYTATDQAGNSTFAERIVEVVDDPSRPRPQTGTPAPEPVATSTEPVSPQEQEPAASTSSATGEGEVSTTTP